MDCFILSRFNSLIAFFFLTLPSHLIGSGDSAKDALAVLKAQRPPSITANVTNIRGHRGQDQPVLWEITSRISDGERVFVIKGDKIIADTIYSSGGGVSVDIRRLQIDSSQAFQIANRAAIKANVGFDSIDYELLAAPLGNAPLWLIYLRDFKGRDVGKLELSGESPKLLRSQWFTPRAVARQPIGPNDANRKAVLRSYQPRIQSNSGIEIGDSDTSTTFARKTGRKLKRGLMTVGNGFTRIFGNQAEVSSVKSRRPSPPTSRRAPR